MREITKRLWGVCAVVALAAGCSRLVPGAPRVYGTVTFQGLPAVAELVFEPTGEGGRPGRPISVFTEKDGTYEIRPPSKQDFAPGPCQITVKVFGNTQTLATSTRTDPIKTVYLRRQIRSGRNRLDFPIRL